MASPASAEEIDAVSCADGTGRVLAFRRWTEKPGEANRRLAGIIGLFYSGPLIGRDAMRDHLRRTYGPGQYAVVVQQKADGVWSYVISEKVTLDPETPDV